MSRGRVLNRVVELSQKMAIFLQEADHSKAIDFCHEQVNWLRWNSLYSRFRLIGQPVNRVSRLIGPNC